jgi:S1-C subfamily serine protease
MKAVVEIIIRDGRVTRPNTGIRFYTGPNQAKSLGVERGLVVVDVVAGSAAAVAGIRGISRISFGSIKLGDTIIEVNGMRCDTEADFLKGIDGNVIGDTIEMTVMRYIEDTKGGAIVNGVKGALMLLKFLNNTNKPFYLSVISSFQLNFNFYRI